MLISFILLSYVIILGAILLSITFNINKYVSSCENPELSNIVSTLFVVSTSMIVSSIGFLVCSLTSRCDSNKDSDPNTKMYRLFLGFNFVLGMILTILGSILISKSKNSECSEKLKSSVSYITIIGVVLTLPSLLFLVISMYKKNVEYRKSKKIGSENEQLGEDEEI